MRRTRSAADALILDEDSQLRDLRAAFESGEILAALRAVGLDAKDLSTGIGADERTVRRWLDGQEPNRSHFEALANLRAVVIYLLQRRALTLAQLPRWLRMPNVELDFSTPLVALAEGHRGEVISAAEAFIAPRPPRAPKRKRRDDEDGRETIETEDEESVAEVTAGRTEE